VDDEPAVRELMTRALSQEGYEVVAVNDGEAGLTATKTEAKPYDLVITNTYLPHLSGEQLIAHLQEWYPNLPILHLEDLTRPKAGEVGIPTLFTPFTLDALSEVVRKLLGERVAGT
jgi:DNA-binding response OmpR family regulator